MGGIYHTKIKTQNGGKWTPHPCGEKEAMTILRPVTHKVTRCERRDGIYLRYPALPKKTVKGPTLKKYSGCGSCRKMTPEQDVAYEKEEELYFDQKDEYLFQKFMHETVRLKLVLWLEKISY